MRVETFHGKQYKTVQDGDSLPVAYHIETPDNIVDILERCRKNKTRLYFEWGDIKTGQGWGDVYDVTGHIGLSRGAQARYPILIHNARSMGGGLILTHCIVSIQEARGKHVIWQHPSYKTGRNQNNPTT